MSWELRGSHPHDPIDPRVYFLEDDRTWFCIQLFHGGEFVDGPGRRYVNGITNFIDFVDASEFSVYDIGQMIHAVGIPDEEQVFYHYKIPGMDLDSGLRPILNEDDIRQVCSYVEENKVIELYVEHGSTNIVDGGCHDEVTIDGHAPPTSQECATQEPEGNVVSQVNNVDCLFGDCDNESSDDDHWSNDQDGNEEDDDSLDSVFIEDAPFFDEVEVDMAEYRSIVEPEDHLDLGSDGDESDIDNEQEGLCDDPTSFDRLTDADEDDNSPPIKSVVSKILRKKRRKSLDSFSCPFYIGQTIQNKEDIKSAVKQYALTSRRQLHIVKNDKIRFRVVCVGKNPTSCEIGPGSGGAQNGESNKADECTIKKVTTKGSYPTCPWVLHCSRASEDSLFVVKTLVDEHKCLQTRDVNLYTITFIAREIEPLIVSQPRIPLRSLQDQIQKKHQINISLHKVFRAKMKAVKKLEGDFTEQYGILRDYCDELKRSNPGTTVKIEVERECNPSSKSRQFRRIYICLGPLKAGFKKCGRSILGLDGCFMKGPYPGQILTAVGVDANNGIYPVAYALVEAETYNSWSWFLELLGDDLHILPNDNFTFITDRQKGLLPAIARMFPSATHRFCLRHIHENMKLKWRGVQFKDLLWKCATATTVPQFQKAMDVIKKQDASLHTWLSKIPETSWSRSHFSGTPKCDVLLNNWCEVFNRQLIGARDKPVITCLEYIKEYLMKRVVAVHNKIAKCEGPLTPSVTNLLNVIKKEASQYNVLMAGGNKYQASGPWLDQCVVDMNTKTCSCRRWELTGIPCKHAVAVIWNMSVNGMGVGNPEQWVSDVYTLEKWKEVYMHTIEPINGVDMWIPSDCPTTLRPPKHKTQIGRPKKKRRKSQGEMMTTIENNGKMTRQGHVKHCGKCKKPGHNSRTCKGQPSQQSSQQT